jgi:GTP cyclohydrolase IA
MYHHHFLPFVGSVDVMYEPGEIIVGLGKISRLVHFFAKRLQFQEKLTKQIAEEFMKSGKAKGVYLRSQAMHLCMGFRGPSDPNAKTSCFYALGTLKNSSKQEEIKLLLERK